MPSGRWIAAVVLCTASTVCGAQAPAAPHLLVLETEAGEIAIELAPSAAPGAVAWIERLARGPIYDPSLVPSPGEASCGYFDGLEFTYTQPKVEIRLESRRPAEWFHLPTEIDAAALGLEGERLADAGAAMDALQLEILPAYRRQRASGEVSELLAGWVATWLESYRSDFLVGVSRRQILEALGQRFTPGLASRPVTRGAVFLEPVSPTHSELQLGIALIDIPRRHGRTMVVGAVVRGLEIADKISIQPLLDPPSKTFRPRRPVRTLRAQLTASAPEPAPPQGGHRDSPAEQQAEAPAPRIDPRHSRPR